MKRRLLPLSLLCLTAIPLATQSLYHDALTLAEILRKDQVRDRASVWEEEAPRIMVEKIYAGLPYFFSAEGKKFNGRPLEISERGRFLVTGLKPSDRLILRQQSPNVDTILWELEISATAEQGRFWINGDPSWDAGRFESLDRFYVLYEGRRDTIIGGIYYNNKKHRSVLEIRTFSPENIRYYPSNTSIYQFTSFDDETPRTGNRLLLHREGAYHFSELPERDTVLLQFPDLEPVFLYRQGEETLVIARAEENLGALPYRDGIIINNLLEKVEIRTETDPNGISLDMVNAQDFAGRELMLRPENWQVTDIELYRANRWDPAPDTLNRIFSWQQNERSLDTFTYLLKGLDPEKHRVLLLQGPDTLGKIRPVDELLVQYDPRANQIHTRRIAPNRDNVSRTFSLNAAQQLTFQGVVGLDENAAPTGVEIPADVLLKEGWLTIYKFDPEAGEFVVHTEGPDKIGDWVSLNQSLSTNFKLVFDFSAFPVDSIAYFRPRGDSFLSFSGAGYLGPEELLIPRESLTPYILPVYLLTDIPRVEIDYIPPTITLEETIPARNIREISTILGTHTRLNRESLASSNLWGDVSFEVRRNPFIGAGLSPYLAENRFTLVDTTQLRELRSRVRSNQLAYYPWRDILYGDQQFRLEKGVSYQELVETYRRPIPTASDNLQQASQRFDSETRRGRGGLNAANIAAGLSDFIVERAQEELNINFLDRLRTGILSDTSEFRILFPSTRDMLTDFQIVHYRSLLDFAKTAFVADLQDLGLNFPRLFELKKYEKLKNDPTVYNIFLIYDLANKVYEGTTMDTVLLHLHGRLQERQENVTREMNNVLGHRLSLDAQERDLLIQDADTYIQELDLFDYETQRSLSHLWRILNTLETDLDAIENQQASVAEIREKTAAIRQTLGANIRTRYGVIGGELNALASAAGSSQAILEEGASRRPIPGAVDSLMKEEKWKLLIYGDEKDSRVAFQKYQSILPVYLKGIPPYEYALKKLPYEKFNEYFDIPPPEGIAIATGLDLCRQLVRSGQIEQRRQWSGLLAESSKNIFALLQKVTELKAISNYDFDQYDRLFVKTINLDWKRILLTDFLGSQIDSLSGNAGNPAFVHELQALVYLKSLLSVEEEPIRIVEWEKINRWRKEVEALQVQAFNDPVEARNLIHFVQSDMKNADEELELAEKFLLEIIEKTQDRLERIERQFEYKFTYKPQEWLEENLWRHFELQANSLFTPEDFMAYVSDFEISYAKKASIRNNEKIAEVEKADQVIAALSSRLGHISRQRQGLENRLNRLDTLMAPKLYRTRRHARDLAALTEMAVHWLDALRDGSMKLDSIVRLDTIVQRVTVMDRSLTGGEAMEIAYDSVLVRPRNIAAGRGLRKWITKQQFDAVMEDSLTRNVFLGLLYQRLSALEDAPSFSPAGLSLVSTKLMNTIYEIDDLREGLRYKKRAGEQLKFKDYYPFIRTTVDFLNILLITPVGQQSLDQQYPTLQMVPQVSDQALSMFENVFAENYADAIRNVVKLLSIVWGMDEEAAAYNRLTSGEPGPGDALAKQERKEVKKNRKVKSGILLYGSFMANVVDAETPDQVKGAIKAVAVPPGSSSVKRNSRFNVSVNGYFGAGVHRETLTNAAVTDNAKGTTVGLSVPVGIAASLGGLGKNKNWSYSLFMSLLDIGAVTAYRIDQTNAGATGDLPELTFGNLLAPGGYFMVNLPKTPFSLGLGAQFGPQARQITVNGAELSSSAWRLGLTFAIDVPIFNLFNR